MNWLQDWRESAAERALLRSWRRAGAFDADGAARAHAVLGGDPAPAQWARFVDRLALWLGIALCASGLLYVVAANWAYLGKSARLYGMQALLVAGVAAALRIGLSRPAGRALLWLSMLQLGGLLALFGQTYQTGADAWQLFAAWAVLSLPWVVAGRHPGLWFTWVLIANVALGGWLSLRTAGDDSTFIRVALALGLFNGVLLLAWELAGHRWPEFRGRAGRWLLSAAAASMLALSSIFAILDHSVAGRAGNVSLAVWCAVTLAAVLTHARWRRDLPALAIWLCGVVAVSATAVLKCCDGRVSEPVMFLLGGGLVLVEATLASLLLRRLRRTEGA